MGRIKGSKNKVVTQEIQDESTVESTIDKIDDGPPDRIAEHLEAEQDAQPPAGKLFETNQVVHQAVEDAADRYNMIKLKRCELSKEEKDAKQHLLLKMIAHDLKCYKTRDNWIVRIIDDQKVKTERNDGESVEGLEYGGINPKSDDDDEDLEFDESIDGEDAA